MVVAMLGQAAPCGGLPAAVECGMLGRLSRSVARIRRLLRRDAMLHGCVGGVRVRARPYKGGLDR